jgi:hypothetical protein
LKFNCAKKSLFAADLPCGHDVTDFHEFEKKSAPISGIRGKGFGFLDMVAT